MVLAGAELLLYPTATGASPKSARNERNAWARVVVGQAVANAIPIATSNRIGKEGGLLFFGSSFVTDGRGEMLASLSQEKPGVAVVELDLDAFARERAGRGVFRDRRPDLSGILTTADGRTELP
jgi:N-carbamoylputrescine amidase